MLSKRYVWSRFALIFAFWSGLTTAGTTRHEFDLFTFREGLSSNHVTAVLQDERGFLWVGTMNGLNRFDGYSFKVFKNEPENPHSISGNVIKDLVQDRDGGIWAATFGEGLNRYDPDTGRFHRFDDGDELSKHLGAAHCLLLDREGAVWVGSGYGLYKGDPRTLRFERQLNRPEDPIDLKANVLELARSGNGDLWIGTYKQGLIRWNPDTGKATRYRAETGSPNALTGDIILELYVDYDDSIWIGTRNGVNRYDPADDSMTHFLSEEGSLGVEAVFRDSTGTLWLGTTDGRLFHYRPNASRFETVIPSGGIAENGIREVYRFFEDRGGVFWVGSGQGLLRRDLNALPVETFTKSFPPEGGLSHDSAQAITVDRNGDLWVGTSRGLNRRKAGSDRFQHFLFDPNDAAGLSNDNVFSLKETSEGELWVGTARGLNRLNKDRKSFTRYLNDPEAPNSLSHSFVTSLAEDAAGRLWVGTLEGGLNRFEADTDTFSRHKAPDNGLPGNVIFSLLADRSDTLWVGTMMGLGRKDRNADKFTAYLHDPDDPTSLIHNHINVLYEDEAGRLWVGTRGGLGRLERESGRFTRFGKAHALSNDTVLGILEDKRGRLWISTTMILAVREPGEDVFKSYDYRDGLQAGQFNYNGYYRDDSDKLYFGGTEGLNVLDPEQVKMRFSLAPTVLTELLLDNRPVNPVEEGSGPLLGPLPAAQRIVLDHRRRMIGFELAALDFAQPERTDYAYMMEGFDKKWVTTDAENRRATYTGLPPGTYRFRVKSKVRGGPWRESGTALQVKMLPAPWASTPARVLYLLVFLCCIAWYLRMQRDRLARERVIADQQRTIAEKERDTAEHLRRVDKLKDEFLANTSHELRTPLNGIIGLAESLINGAAGKIAPRMEANLVMIVQSGQRLAHLVNDILDFSKMRNDEISLHQTPVDVRAAADIVLTLCRPLAAGKKLALINAVPVDLPPVSADEDRLQQIFFNLIGNAVKFTESGSVTVSARLTGNAVSIVVEDTGPGIPGDQHDAVFASFVQADGSETRAQGGTGLGLAITRHLVHLHGGSMTLDSSPGHGSRFGFDLPTTSAIPRLPGPEPEPSAMLPVVERVPDNPAELPCAPEQVDFKDFRILVVDDDPVNRRVLANHLAPRCYEVVEANDGPEALHYFEKKIPFDLVILDVMMPGMSGFQVCRQLRRDHHVQDLPILFLTAKGGLEDLVTAFTIGGNDFLTKPFSRDELMMRVRTHLQLLDLNRGLEEKVDERTRALLQTQKQLIETAHQAGMAEIATNTLHEIGNALNSLNVSLQVMEGVCADNRPLALLGRMAGLLQSADSLTRHLWEHPKGRRLTSLVINCAGALDAGWQKIGKETDRLREQAGNIASVLKKQNEWIYRERAWQPVDINRLIREYMDQEKTYLETVGIEIHLHLESIRCIEGDESILSRVLMYAVQNAEEAIRATGAKGGAIRIHTTHRKGEVIVSIEDDGCGIAAENLSRVFSQGFTTKPEGRGFGLHYCANAVTRMGGTIKLLSRGEGHGTSLWMTFPIAEIEEAALECGAQNRSLGI
ncbi:MAG: two-component regulator propeller domain-containing protein [Acidobacteriota bacterium]|nr:two-component regulator propeller domain-containing protein [Acidobacteriota bacterium]